MWKWFVCFMLSITIFLMNPVSAFAYHTNSIDGFDYLIFDGWDFNTSYSCSCCVQHVTINDSVHYSAYPNYSFGWILDSPFHSGTFNVNSSFTAIPFESSKFVVIETNFLFSLSLGTNYYDDTKLSLTCGSSNGKVVVTPSLIELSNSNSYFYFDVSDVTSLTEISLHFNISSSLISANRDVSIDCEYFRFKQVPLDSHLNDKIIDSIDMASGKIINNANTNTDKIISQINNNNTNNSNRIISSINSNVNTIITTGGTYKPIKNNVKFKDKVTELENVSMQLNTEVDLTQVFAQIDVDDLIVRNNTSFSFIKDIFTKTIGLSGYSQVLFFSLVFGLCCFVLGKKLKGG